MADILCSVVIAAEGISGRRAGKPEERAAVQRATRICEWPFDSHIRKKAR
jgi:hypothetical protein